ncbi:MAG: PD40 domain-containing protein [Planctomycetes bacterium]|nr:PD40 domain-containing protein [Planctomycetota bacterium]
MLLVVAVALAAAGCGRSRPARPATGPAVPQALEVKLVWRLGLSPSGEWLTFESVLVRGPEAGWSVSWLMPSTGGSLLPLEPPTISSAFAVWSPTKDELAYVRVAETSGLLVRTVEEPEPTVSVDFGGLWLSQLCWSPDGARLACLATDFVRRRNDPALIDAGTGEHHFARLQVPAAVSPLFFAPTGEHLVFARGSRPQEPGREPTQYLMEASTTGPEVTELVSFEANVCQLAVPIGDRFLVQLLRGPARTPGQPQRKELALISYSPFGEHDRPGEEDPAGPPASSIQSLGDGSFASAQSLRERDGQLELIFERAGDLFIRPLAPGSTEDVLRVTDTPEVEAGAIFSADGGSIFFVRSVKKKATGISSGSVSHPLHEGPEPPSGEEIPVAFFSQAPPTQVVWRSLADGRETVLAALTPELVKQVSNP